MKQRPKAQERPWLAPLVVAAISASAFLPTLAFEFTYDDHNHFLRNPFVQRLGNFSEFLPWRYFKHEFPDQGRPLLVLTEMLDRSLGGSSGTCHLQSTLWHALTASLVFALARRLGAARSAAALAGILFGLHPLNVETVAGISNREDALVGCLGLGALLVARRALAGGWWPLVGLGVLYAAALGAKENALAVPGLFVLLWLCSAHFRPPHAARRVAIRIGLAFAIVTAGWAGFQYRLGYPSLLSGSGGRSLEQTLHSPISVPALRTLVGFQSKEPAERPPANRSPYGEMRAMDGAPLEAFRAWQVIVPWPSSPEYDLRPFRSRVAFLLGVASLLALGAVAVRDFSKTRRLTLAIGWFAIATLPVVVPSLMLNPLADRYLYFPIMGFTIVLARFLLERLEPMLRRPNAGSWAGFAVGVSYFAITSANVASWKDDLSLFEKAKQYAPLSARVHHNLGTALAKSDRLEEAEQELRTAVELDPTLSAAHFNLGLLAEKRGDRKAAIEHYRATLESHPVLAERSLFDQACTRLGTLLIRDGRSDEAASLLERQNSQDPGSACSVSLRKLLSRAHPAGDPK